MDESALLIDAFGRLPDLIDGAIDGLTPEELHWTPSPGANSIGWLVWHLTRIQDDHIADVLDDEQVWTSGDWAARFGLADAPDNTGYGHTPAEVASVRPESAEALRGYYDAVAQRTRKLLNDVTPRRMERVVDEAWDPPVTLGVRLVSVLADDLQHVGQAAYVRGLLRTRR